MKITRWVLERLMACRGAIEKFTKEWPGGVLLDDAALLHAIEIDLDVDWFAGRILTEPARDIYAERIVLDNRALDAMLEPIRFRRNRELGARSARFYAKQDEIRGRYIEKVNRIWDTLPLDQAQLVAPHILHIRSATFLMKPPPPGAKDDNFPFVKPGAPVPDEATNALLLRFRPLLTTADIENIEAWRDYERDCEYLSYHEARVISDMSRAQRESRALLLAMMIRNGDIDPEVSQIIQQGY